MKQPVKKFLSAFIYCCVVIGLFFLCLEAIMRFGLIRPTFDNHGYHFYLDKDILFRIKPNCRHDINSHGYRTPEYTKKKSKKRIIFLGDSFIMGKDVGQKETIPANFQKLIGQSAEVINLGIVGYGPDQSLIQLEKEVLALEPDTVILGIYPANDYQDIRRNKLFSLDAQDELLRQKETLVSQLYPDWQVKYLWDYIQYQKWGKDKFKDLFKNFFHDGFDPTFVLFPESEEAKVRMKTMYALLKQIHGHLKARGIPLYVVIFPSFEQLEQEYTSPIAQIPKERFFHMDNLIEYFCRNLGVESLVLYKHFLAYPVDYSRFEREKTNHYNAKTTAEIARLLHEMVY